MLQQLHRDYERQGVMVMGISLDDKPNTASKFAGSLRITYPLLIHPTLITAEVEQQHFGIVGLPTTFLIDRAGIIRKKVIGFATRTELEASLRELL